MTYTNKEGRLKDMDEKMIVILIALLILTIVAKVINKFFNVCLVLLIIAIVIGLAMLYAPQLGLSVKENGRYQYAYENVNNFNDDYQLSGRVQ